MGLCPGDSGGPFMRRNPKTDKYTILGNDLHMINIPDYILNRNNKSNCWLNFKPDLKQKNLKLNPNPFPIILMRPILIHNNSKHNLYTCIKWRCCFWALSRFLSKGQVHGSTYSYVRVLY